MGLRINTNVEALNAWRNLTHTAAQLSRAMERLSSGFRINRASDDAAGLAISEKLRSQIRGLRQAARNAQDGISLIQTAEGAMTEAHAVLQRMRELAIQAANDTLTDTERDTLQKEIDQLLEELDRIATTTEFNTNKLLNGDFATTPLVFHVGANQGQTISVTIADAQVNALGIAGLAVTSQTLAEQAIASLDGAISQISTQRATLGAIQNRLEHTVANLGVAAENLQASESRIRDTDMALEMMNFTKLQILQQAGAAMLAQANLSPQAILQLLR